MGDALSCPERSLLHHATISPLDHLTWRPFGCWEYFAFAVPKYRSSCPAATSFALECFEFALYGSAFTQIKANFFDGSSTMTWICFSVPFVARPLGGLGFGLLADWWGRRIPVIMVSYGVLFATVGQGCIPSNIGIWGPTMLITFRVLQGLTYGAISSTLVYSLEVGSARSLAFGPMLAQCGGNLGAVASFLTYAVLDTLLTEEAMAAWGWRLPYFLVIGPGLWNAWQTHSLHETNAFQRSKAARSAGGDQELCRPACLEPFALHGLPTALCFLGLVAQAIGLYMRIYLVEWLPLYSGWGSAALYLAALTGLTSVVVMVPLAWLTDYYGAAPVMAVGYSASALMAMPLFFYLQRSTHILVPTVAFVLLGAMTALIVPSIVFAGQLYPTSTRGAAFGIMYNVDFCLFGGMAPALLAWWSTLTALAPGYYLVGCCIASASAAVIAICLESCGVLCITHLHSDMLEADSSDDDGDRVEPPP